MAPKFDFILVVFAALFLLGVWASQATAHTLEEPKPSMFERSYHNNNNHVVINKAAKQKNVKVLKSFSKYINAGMNGFPRSSGNSPVPRSGTSKSYSGSGSFPTQQIAAQVVPIAVNQAAQVANNAANDESPDTGDQENSGGNHTKMGGWLAVLLPVVFFLLLQPGLLFNIPGND